MTYRVPTITPQDRYDFCLSTIRLAKLPRHTIQKRPLLRGFVRWQTLLFDQHFNGLRYVYYPRR